MDLNEDKLRAAASLARIRIHPQEVPEFMEGLSKILSWVEQLDQVNTDAIAPMTTLFVKEAPLRADEVTNGGIPEKIVANGPDVTLNMFAVPKVLD
jgi:aspartyl-tRNA(Asn)/glutamyl-tRNA(Gln) amidotransferase subunit C